jgi:N-acetylmuramoyl-L-alanine amidase
MELIRQGQRGEEVRDVQHRLLGAGIRIDPDELVGTFGPSTEAAVREFQRRRGLPPDGVVGSDTWGELVEVGYRIGDRTLYLRSPAFRGDDVRELQRMLNALGFDAGKQDGIFGSKTARAVREFQRNVAAKADGIVGLATVRSLEGMRPTLHGPSRAVVREAETASRMGASLVGSIIAVDPGHGSTDPGIEAGGLVEADVASAVAMALVDDLTRRGARPLLLRTATDNPDVHDRARRANAADATACISIHLGGGDLVPCGFVCCYFGTPSTHSPMGMHLAGSLRSSLNELGLPDGGVRPLAITMLRETRMPAVHVELAVTANEDEAERVAKPAFPASVASAIADGLERFLGAGLVVHDERASSGRA